MTNKADKEKREKINSITRYIAFNIFNHRGKPNYTNAYDKLWTIISIEHGFSISERLKKADNEKLNMFNVIDSQELEKVLQSSIQLLNMYKEVIANRVA